MDVSLNKQVLFIGMVLKEDQDGEYFEGFCDCGCKGGFECMGWIEYMLVGFDDFDMVVKIDFGDLQIWCEGNLGFGICLVWKMVQDDWDWMGQINLDVFVCQCCFIWLS